MYSLFLVDKPFSVAGRNVQAVFLNLYKVYLDEIYNENHNNEKKEGQSF